ncbi:MAG TPA: type II toxin-antitoxin system VapB family antitoxin [Rhodoblastus sp.]|nr:type II toxin-antitoxin system VapB family antitoxin [Rhodoblastus sp.]
MGLFIRDPAVDALASELQRTTRAATKTEAVRAALEQALARARKAQSFDERNAGVMKMADALGRTRADFDMKAFTDAMWED